jgi:hypothetical protein
MSKRRQHDPESNHNSGDKSTIPTGTEQSTMFDLPGIENGFVREIFGSDASKFKRFKTEVSRGVEPAVLVLCAECNRIRDAESNWVGAEQHLLDQWQGRLSHGLCPGCLQKLYPDLVISSGSSG